MIQGWEDERNNWERVQKNDWYVNLDYQAKNELEAYHNTVSFLTVELNNATAHKVDELSRLKWANEKKIKKLENQVKKLKGEAPKLGRPKKKKVNEFDKWGMLKVRESNKKYILPDKAIIKLPTGGEIPLTTIATERRLLSLIRAAECGAKDQKRQVKLLPSYNSKLLTLFREFTVVERNMVIHPVLGKMNLGSQLYNYIDDYHRRKNG